MSLADAPGPAEILAISARGEKFMRAAPIKESAPVVVIFGIDAKSHLSPREGDAGRFPLGLSKIRAPAASLQGFPETWKRVRGSVVIVVQCPVLHIVLGV